MSGLESSKVGRIRKVRNFQKVVSYQWYTMHWLGGAVAEGSAENAKHVGRLG
jgi:hypothetical protein